MVAAALWDTHYLTIEFAPDENLKLNIADCASMCKVKRTISTAVSWRERTSPGKLRVTSMVLRQW